MCRTTGRLFHPTPLAYPGDCPERKNGGETGPVEPTPFIHELDEGAVVR